MILVISLVPLQSAYAASISFNFPTTPSDGNLGNTGTINPANPQVGSSSTGVHVLFTDLDNIFLSSSKDAGDTFNTQDISGAITPANPGDHQISVSGSNVYTLWTDNKILNFRASNDNGDNLLTTLILSTNTESQSPQIASSSGNAYAIWRDVVSGDDNILFRTISGAGTTLGNLITLGTTTDVSPDPQVAAQGNKVYAIWQDTTDIKFRRSLDNGATFDVEKDIGDTGGAPSSEKPRIATDGTNVYVVWRNGNSIFYSSSTNMGETFGIGPKSISTDIPGEINRNPQLAVENNQVYVAWWDQINPTRANGEIKFVKSNNGVDFTAPSSHPNRNLSDDSQKSESPQITASGTNVYVVWTDVTDNKISSVASSDNGDNFDGAQQVSENGVLAPQQASIAAGSLFVAWQELVSNTWDVIFKKGTIGGPIITFDSNEYKLSDTATITITEDVISGLPVIPTVTSTSDATGIILTLTPTGTPGVHQGTITFDKNTSDSANDILKASSGDTITATFGGNGGTSKIFTATIEPGRFGIDRSESLEMSITDHNSNEDPLTAETITVHVTSEADTDGIDLTLTETDIDTGIFGGVGNTELKVMVGQALVTTDNTITITNENPNVNVNKIAPDTTTAHVTSTSDPVGIIMTLTETGDDTDDFEGTFSLGDTSINGSQIEATGGDFITIEHPSGFKTIGMVTPNPNPENGIIEVNSPDVGNDVLTISYNPIITVNVSTQPAAGGGGGGLVRPGLVVNVLAGAGAISGLFGGGGSGSAVPLITGSTLFLEPQAGITQLGQGFSHGWDSLQVSLEDISEPVSIQTGEATSFTFDVYENQGITNLEHATLYFFIGEDADLSANHNDVSKSDTYILFDAGQSVHVTDPHGYFESASFDVSEITPWKLKVIYDITFAKPMDTASLLIRTWDLDKNTADKVFVNAIQVKEPSFFNVPLELVSQDSTQTELADIPVWVKNNAMWWQQKQIDDSDFVAGIQYLINESIIRMPETETSGNVASEDIPNWIREVAGYWANDSITDAEFVQSMQWLISNGVMVVA